MAIKRFGPAEIIAAMGAEHGALLEARFKGGRANQSGNRFEHLFAAHRVARLARRYLDCGQDAIVEWQAKAFVDDLVVRRDDTYAFEGYQLKNTVALSWHAGRHPLEQSFLMQHQLCKAEGYLDIRLRLVCSSEEVAAAMQRALPHALSGIGGVWHFPYAPTVLSVLYQHPWMAEDFGYLSKAECPTVVQAEQVATILMGAIAVAERLPRVSELLHKARSVSPVLVRSLRSDKEAQDCLLSGAAEAMQAWPDFSYRIIKGFLTWEAFGGSTSGSLPFDCFDVRFMKWQSTLIGQRHSSFEEAEALFI